MYYTTLILKTMLDKARENNDKETERKILCYITRIIGASRP
jgi:hypothetical protein